MDDKQKYYNALKINNQYNNEIDIGEQLGFDEETTRRIISILLTEHKIQYVTNGICNYKVIRKRAKK